MPLNGLKVLDLTLARAGPTAVRHLADWGADVIKIEPPATDGEEITGNRHGFDFQNLHRNKRAMTLNLKTPEGHAAFMRLAKTADVVVENMRAQVKHRLKVSYDDVKAVNPRIVYGSISGFGQDRAVRASRRRRSDRAGHGRADVDHRPAGPGAGARRHSDRRPDRGQPAGAWHHDGDLRPRAHRRRPLGHHLAAGSADLHAGLPGLALADREGGGAAGRQRSPDRHSRPACSRPPTGTSTSPPVRAACSAASARRSASRSGRTSRSGRIQQARSKHRKEINAAIGDVTKHEAVGILDRTAGRRTACRAGRSTRSTRCSPIRR